MTYGRITGSRDRVAFARITPHDPHSTARGAFSKPHFGQVMLNIMRRYTGRVSLYEQLFARLSEADVRYVVVGGVAVILQGYMRLTADVDFMLDLEYSNALRAVQALEACGLRPIVPVRASDFADPAIRRDWIDNKNMKVFSMRDIIAKERAR
jgi:hypothetical protein